MAESEFRSQWTSWSRRPEASTSTSTAPTNPLLSKISSLNPFGSNGYIRLPTTNQEAQLPARTREEEDAGWFASELHALFCNCCFCYCFHYCCCLPSRILSRPFYFTTIRNSSNILRIFIGWVLTLLYSISNSVKMGSPARFRDM